jgi:hypothetical protein
MAQPVLLLEQITELKFLAGPRDDPFFFDLARFKEIIGGTQWVFEILVWIRLQVPMYYPL